VALNIRNFGIGSVSG